MNKLPARPGFRLAVLVLTLVAIVSQGCESSNDTIGGNVTYSVVYLVNAEFTTPGSSEIDLVRYDDQDGNVAEESQADGTSQWSKAVTLVSGDTIYLWASGTMINGRLTLQASIFGDDGSIFARTNNSMNFDTGEGLWADIPRETLP